MSRDKSFTPQERVMDLLSTFRSRLHNAVTYDCTPYPSEGKLKRQWEMADAAQAELVAAIVALSAPSETRESEGWTVPAPLGEAQAQRDAAVLQRKEAEAKLADALSGTDAATWEYWRDRARKAESAPAETQTSWRRGYNQGYDDALKNEPRTEKPTDSPRWKEIDELCEGRSKIDLAEIVLLKEQELGLERESHEVTKRMLDDAQSARTETAPISNDTLVKALDFICHKRSCPPPASNFQKHQPCACGRDALVSEIRTALGRK